MKEPLLDKLARAFACLFVMPFWVPIVGAWLLWDEHCRGRD
jgi:hypothetical protein